MTTVMPRESHVTAAGAAAASLLTFTIPAVLRGPSAMNGSTRGTAVITWLGSVGFLLYNSLMFVFATPANRFFLLYLVMLALGAWSAGAVLWQADVAAFGAVLQADAREGDRRLPVGGSSPERGHLAWRGHRLGRGPARLAVAARQRVSASSDAARTTRS